MNKKNMLKSIAQIVFSNCTTILSGIIVSFLIPKILSVYDYGMYKTFTLYVSYIGFCSFGIIDGIVLKYGNKDYDELDIELFRTCFKWYTIVNSIFSIIMIFIALCINDNNYSFILTMLGINVLAVNFTGYYQQISQITQRFKEYSVRKIIQSCTNILVVILLFLIYLKVGNINYRYYIISIVLINSILSIWYLYTYRKITFGKGIGLKNTKKLIISLIKLGFPLLFANLLSTLILTLDRQFVNILFDTETYATYAFAYNMLALVTVAMSAISTVLYPSLKRTDKDILKENFSKLNAIILIIVFLLISIYFPLAIFINWFLPKYNASLLIFRVIFPGLAFSSAITVVMHNYYKTINKNNIYFFKSVIVLVVSVISNVVAYVIFRTPISISIASIVTMIFWYLYVEQYFIKEYNYDGKKNFVYIIMMMIGFYLISMINNNIIGFIFYLIFFIIITIILYKTIILDIKNSFNLKNKN